MSSDAKIIVIDDTLEPKYAKFEEEEKQDGSTFLDSLDPHHGLRFFDKKLPPHPFRQMCFHSNVRSEGYTPGADGFFDAFNRAYNDHLPLILSPDDVNLVANLNLASYVNQNAEAMRSVFVDHQGKKKLTVTEDQGTEDADWTQFFGRMQAAIADQVKGDTVGHLQHDFSTSTWVESAVGAATIMTTFKQYFDYGRCIPCCGIPSVHFLGTRADWLKLQDKFAQLATVFQEHRRLTGYYQGLAEVTRKLIDTFDDSPDLEWWDHVMDRIHGRLGSGSTSYYSGWFNRFYINTYDRQGVERGDFELENGEVEVQVENHVTATRYRVKVLAGWVGSSRDKATLAVRPVMGLGVYEEIASREPM